MALGGLSNTVTTGGGGAGGNAAIDSKVVIGLGVSPGGTENVLYSFNNAGAVRSTLGAGSTGGPLAEWCAFMLKHGARPVYAMKLAHTTAGAKSAAVTLTGTGLATLVPTICAHKSFRIKCHTGGTIATAKFQFSDDGGATYGSAVTSADTGGGAFLYRPPGWMGSLSFAAAIYVANETVSYSTTTTSATNSAGWVGVVTATWSPIDNYDCKCTVITAGGLGTAVVRVSLDNGNSSLPDVLIPAGGVFAVPGAGFFLTAAVGAGNFVADDYYTFLMIPASYSSTNMTAATDAIRDDATAPQAALLHCIGTPAAAAAAVTQADDLDTEIGEAFTEHRFYAGVVECPTTSDAVVSGGNAIANTETDSTVKAATSTTTADKVSIFAGSARITGPLSGAKLYRGAGWPIVAEYVETEPREDVAGRDRGPLDVFAVRRDEWFASVSLHDAKFNVLMSQPPLSGYYLSIQSGVGGWRNLTADASYVDAQSTAKLLNPYLKAITAAGLTYLGTRQPVNSDGTIEENRRQAISGHLDGVAKKSVGLDPGGSYSNPQASSATAEVDPDSQLGSAPKRLDINYTLQPLGQVTDVDDSVQFAGTISL